MSLRIFDPAAARPRRQLTLPQRVAAAGAAEACRVRAGAWLTADDIYPGDELEFVRHRLLAAAALVATDPAEGWPEALLWKRVRGRVWFTWSPGSEPLPTLTLE